MTRPSVPSTSTHRSNPASVAYVVCVALSVVGGVFAAVGSGLVTPSSVRAQDEPKSTSTTTVRINASSGVIRQHRPDRWSVLSVNAVNTGDEPRDGFVAAWFPPENGRQFARRLWVPEHALRYSWMPLKVPGDIPRNVERVDLTIASFDASSGREILQRRAGDLMTNTVFAAIDHDASRTGTLLEKRMPDENFRVANVDASAVKTLVVARMSAGLSQRTADFEGDFLPPWSDVWQSLDEFMLTSDRILHDTAGLAALRGWVRDGGRLWIMADRVSPATIQAVLGNAVNFEVVDRVELDRYSLDAIEQTGQPATQDPCEYEEPVSMVRVVTSATDITHRVNGWPAAIWLSYGEGDVLLTTLDARGWCADGESSERPTDGLKSLARRFFTQRDSRMAIRGLQPSLQQQIGYHIPPRSLGVTILGAYCGVLLVGGGWLARRGRLDSLAWLVPAATVVVTIVLFGVGAANTSSVPATIALTELWRVNPNSNETRLDGLAAFYDQQTRDIVWQSEGGTWVLPDPQPDSEIRRLVWNDGNAFETQNATTRAGSVGIAALNGHRPLNARISAVATFGPAGLEGRLESGGLEGVTDPVLIVPPTMAGAVTMKPDGSFSSGADQILPADQYMAESLLNDEQQRRHGVYRWLFNPADNWAFPRQPSFVFWSQRGDDGLKLPTGFEVSGSSIVVVPVTLQRCLPGAEFQIPPTFLRAEVSAGRAGMSTAFNPRSGQWVTGLTAQNETVLRFVLPSEVLPCQLVRGELSVRINAPSRDVSIWTGDPKAPISLMQRRNPNGVLTFPLTAEHLVLDERNGVKIGIEIGPTEKQRAQAATEQERMKRAREGQAPLPVDPKADASQQFDNSTWQVDYVRLTVAGRTMGQTPGSTTGQTK